MSGAPRVTPDQPSASLSALPSAAPAGAKRSRSGNRILVGIAQGLWIGRIGFMPGTWGSLLGLIWTALLLSSGNLWIYLGGTMAGLAFSVWSSGVAEEIMKQRDPGSVVLDEIASVPLCFLGWVLLLVFGQGTLPDLGYFFSGWNLAAVGGVFVAFRFFDIVKPWPVKQSQSLRGGLGVTADDILAAVYVNAVFLGVWGINSFLAPGKQL